MSVLVLVVLGLLVSGLELVLGSEFVLVSGLGVVLVLVLVSVLDWC